MERTKGKEEKTQAEYVVMFYQDGDDGDYSVEFRADADLTAAEVEALAVVKMEEQDEKWSVDEVKDWGKTLVAKCLAIGEVNEGMYKEYENAKVIKGHETNPTLCIGECECGYHFGVDFTYLDQVEDFMFPCPKCGKIIDTAQVFVE